MKVGIVRDAIYLEHVTESFHPENPGRLRAIYGRLEAMDQAGLVYVPARAATDEEIALNHDPAYVSFVRETKGSRQRRLDPDTVTSARSYEAACMAAGGFLELIDACLSGKVDNGFALVRPPGHHAEAAKAMGFCIFNNCAIGARHLLKKHGYRRVMIVDFDLHHGNGTQHSFYDDPAVLYLSTHQYPYYPGTGWFDEVGEKEGKGYTINVPMTYGMNDADYIHVFEEIVVPVSRLFRPEIVLVSAGFDIHRDDPLGGMAVSERGFARMTRILMDIAKSECGGKLLFVLEGGYDLEALANSVEAVVMELKRMPVRKADELEENRSRAVLEVVSRAKQTLKPYWGEF